MFKKPKHVFEETLLTLGTSATGNYKTVLKKKLKSLIQKHTTELLLFCITEQISLQQPTKMLTFDAYHLYGAFKDLS